MRYLLLTDTDRSEMLATIGESSIDELFVDVPEEARLTGPIAGLPLHTNEMALEDDPALVNTSPEDDGWFFRMTVGDKSELDGLMDAKAYKAFCDEL